MSNTNHYTIYLVTNHVTDKQYFGKTTRSIQERWREHQSQSESMETKLCFAMRKYGIQSFTVDEFYQTSDVKHLSDMEQHFIKLYDTKENGYNMTDGGEGIIGYKHTQEALDKISAAHSGKVVSEETRERVRQAKLLSDYTDSEETRQKKSESHKGLKHSAETRAKMSGEGNGMYGKNHTKESKLKMSESQIGENGTKRARKGWETRRAKHGEQKISESALKGWETRRRKQLSEKESKQTTNCKKSSN